MARPILIVEDDQDEALLIERALKRAGVSAPTNVVPDGDAAIAYLDRSRDYLHDDERKAQLVLLDLNLPRVSGFDVLRWIRRDGMSRSLPIVVLTSSDEPSDISAAYDLGANSYVVKPRGLAELAEVARRLREYWLELNAMPPHA